MLIVFLSCHVADDFQKQVLWCHFIAMLIVSLNFHVADDFCGELGGHIVGAMLVSRRSLEGALIDTRTFHYSEMNHVTS